MIPSWLSIAALASLFGLLYQTISPSVSGGDAGDLIAVGKKNIQTIVSTYFQYTRQYSHHTYMIRMNT